MEAEVRERGWSREVSARAGGRRSLYLMRTSMARLKSRSKPDGPATTSGRRTPDTARIAETLAGNETEAHGPHATDGPAVPGRAADGRAAGGGEGGSGSHPAGGRRGARARTGGCRADRVTQQEGPAGAAPPEHLLVGACIDRTVVPTAHVRSRPGRRPCWVPGAQVVPRAVRLMTWCGLATPWPGARASQAPGQRGVGRAVVEAGRSTTPRVQSLREVQRVAHVSPTRLDGHTCSGVQITPPHRRWQVPRTVVRLPLRRARWARLRCTAPRPDTRRFRTSTPTRR